MDKLLDRIRRGQHSALLGVARVNPRVIEDFCVVRVNCNHPPQPLGPILEARHKVEQLLDAKLPLLDLAADRVRSGLRRRILGEAFEPGRDGGFVEALNRLVRESERPCVLVFEAVDTADEATLSLLSEIISQPGRVQAPMLLVFRMLEPTDAAAALLGTLERVAGPEAVLQDTAEKRTEARAGAPAPEPTLPILSAPVLRVLRAGALVGPGFEADLVASLLGISPLEVLERLQEAFDLGVPVEDLGEGQFNLPDNVSDELRDRLLPSMAMAWHRRLAALLAGTNGSTIREDDQATAEGKSTSGGCRLEPSIESSLAPLSGPGRMESPAKSAEDAAGGGVREASMAATAPFPGLETAGHRGADMAGDSEADGNAGAVADDSMSPGQENPASRGALVGECETQSSEVIQDFQLRDTAALKEPEAGSGSGTDPAQRAAELSAQRASSASEMRDPEKKPEGASEDSRAGKTNGVQPRLKCNLEAPTAHEIDGVGRVSGNGPAAGDAAGASKGERDITAGPRTIRLVTDKPRRERDEIRLREPFQPEGGYTAPLNDGRPPPLREKPTGRAGERAIGLRGEEPRAEPARAAGHFAAAGEHDQAAERYQAAANQAANLGAYPQAIAYARKGLAMLERLPMSPERRLLRIQLLSDLGRFHWEVAGPGADFTLAGALALLEEAHALLRPEDRIGLKTGLKSLIAGVCYDLGDPASLDRALHELTEASRMLQESGDALGAARLLNDQAAVWVRLGNPVRAVYMLNESRKVYEMRAEHDTVAMAELAETYHLLARLTFHVPSRPGLEIKAVQMGVDHARSAEAAYRQLGGARELGRVWETLGRLMLKSQDIQRAHDYLRRAMDVQQRVGDMLGLARSTGALAEVLSAQGSARDALALLSESIELNLEKGSPLGLAYNRRALATMVAATPFEQRAATNDLLRKVTERLTGAEAILGRVALPENEPE